MDNWARLFLALSVLSVTGCDIFNLNANRGFHFDEKTFAAQSKAWEDQNIANYSFTLEGRLPYWNFSRAILMRDYKVKVTVKNGVMNSFEYVGDIPHSEDGESILEPEYTSISDMYQKISDWAREEKQWWKDYSDGGFVSKNFKVKYDPALHYINYFEPVTRVESGWILDTTEHAVYVSEFTILD